MKILEYAVAGGFVLVSIDSDFERLLDRVPGAKIIILRSCNYPTGIASGVLRRNAIRIAELAKSATARLVFLESSPRIATVH